MRILTERASAEPLPKGVTKTARAAEIEVGEGVFFDNEMSSKSFRCMVYQAGKRARREPVDGGWVVRRTA